MMKSTMNVTIGIHQFLMTRKLASPPTSEMVKALNKEICRGLMFLVSNMGASYGIGVKEQPWLTVDG